MRRAQGALSYKARDSPRAQHMVTFSPQVIYEPAVIEEMSHRLHRHLTGHTSSATSTPSKASIAPDRYVYGMARSEASATEEMEQRLSVSISQYPNPIAVIDPSTEPQAPATARRRSGETEAEA